VKCRRVRGWGLTFRIGNFVIISLLARYPNKIGASKNTCYFKIIRLYTNAGLPHVRPNIMTTLTTFSGLVAMIFETSRQARFMIPMAQDDPTNDLNWHT